MAYVSLYRKWRPQSFDEIAGQSHITQTLKNAVAGDRVSHAYLFCGPRGTGKTSTARALAKAINCAKGPTPTPCNTCESCRSIADGSSLDVLELDAASNRKVDQIRDLLEKIPYSSAEGHKKVYIVDEVHMLTDESFNTLLKTLEEPPEHVVFVLATTEAHKVLPTILSRCQRFDFRRISAPDIEARLTEVAEAEGIAIEPAALSLIAHHAQGALRDALGALEQLASYANGAVTGADVVSLLGLTDSELLFAFTDILGAADLGAGLVFVDELVEKGFDMRQFTQDLLGHLRNLFLVQSVPGISPAGMPDELHERLHAQAAGLTTDALLSFIHTLSDTYNQSRWATDMRLLFELALFKMVRADADTSTEGILARLERLERTMLKGAPPAPSSREVRDVSPAPAATPRRTKTPAAEVPAMTGAQSCAQEAPAEAPAEAAVGIDAIRLLWPQVLKAVKKKKPSRYAFFAAGVPKRIEGGTLIVAYKESDKAFVETPENLQVLQEALTIAGGFTMPIRCELANGGSQTVAVVEGPAEDGPLPPDEYIKLVQDTFGAKIVEDISIDEITSREDA